MVLQYFSRNWIETPPVVKQVTYDYHTLDLNNYEFYDICFPWFLHLTLDTLEQQDEKITRTTTYSTPFNLHSSGQHPMTYFYTFYSGKTPSLFSLFFMELL